MRILVHFLFLLQNFAAMVVYEKQIYWVHDSGNWNIQGHGTRPGQCFPIAFSYGWKVDQVSTCERAAGINLIFKVTCSWND